MVDEFEDLPRPEPKEIDEKRAMELRFIMEDAILRAKPNQNERCQNCFYYLNPDEELNYCWHPKLRILVGGAWWCQWWEKIPEE